MSVTAHLQTKIRVKNIQHVLLQYELSLLLNAKALYIPFIIS